MKNIFKTPLVDITIEVAKLVRKNTPYNKEYAVQEIFLFVMGKSSYATLAHMMTKGLYTSPRKQELTVEMSRLITDIMVLAGSGSKHDLKRQLRRAYSKYTLALV